MQAIKISAKNTAEFRRRAGLLADVVLEARKTARLVMGEWEFKKVDAEATKKKMRFVDYLYEWANAPLSKASE